MKELDFDGIVIDSKTQCPMVRLKEKLEGLILPIYIGKDQARAILQDSLVVN